MNVKQLSSPLIALTLTLLPFLLKCLLHLKYKRKKPKDDGKEENYYQCVFINMENFDCKQHLLDRKECKENCSYAYEKSLFSFVASAKKSICVCMYILSLKQFNYELIRAKRRGVNVRVICDKVMANTSTMQENIRRLKNEGIICKYQPSKSAFMHHKFCLIDKEDENLARMFFGSLNLTSQALSKNFEYFVLTNDKNYIGRFSEEFEELWELFSQK